jgi:hypothetical protein
MGPALSSDRRSRIRMARLDPWSKNRSGAGIWPLHSPIGRNCGTNFRHVAKDGLPTPAYRVQRFRNCDRRDVVAAG